jgi:hypothetical protein
MTMNSETKSRKPKFARDTRARLRTSTRDRTVPRWRQSPTKRSPTRVAAAVPATM